MMTSDENVSNEELSMLKQQMKALKPVRVEKSSSGHSSRDEIKELREQVRELREVILEMSYLPDEIQRLREAVQDLEEQRQKNDHRSKKGGVSPQEFEDLQHDVEKVHASMKKQRGELVRNLEGAFTKIDEQKEVIEEQQRDIDALKKEIKIVSLKATEADKEAKKALVEASTSGDQTQSKEAPTKAAPAKQEPSPPPTPSVTRRWRPPAATVKPASPKNEPKVPLWAKKNQLKPVSIVRPIIPESDSPRGTKKPTIEVKDSDSDSDSDSEAVPSLPPPPLKTPDDSDSDESDKPKRDSPRDSDSDSDNEEVRKNPPPRTHRQSARTFESRRAPPMTKDDEDDSSEGDDVVEIDVTPSPQHGGGRMARRCSLESVQTIDTNDTKPKKKSISLLPHKSADIFEQQRKDPVLRKLLMKGKTPNMTVRKVHGKSLVFFTDRVYIPATLREKTLDFYWKKYKKNQTPLIQLEKNCFWADMQMDFKRFDLDKRGARVELKVTAPRTIVH
mgnify:CR=1 FL=1